MHTHTHTHTHTLLLPYAKYFMHHGVITSVNMSKICETKINCFFDCRTGNVPSFYQTFPHTHIITVIGETISYFMQKGFLKQPVPGA